MLACTLLFALSGSVFGQRIPPQEYIHYVPLETPKVIRETDASRELALFGDRSMSSYRDINPRDGIDDARHDVLMGLAKRFAPLLIQNSAMSAPLDLRLLTDAEGRRSLYRDTWNLKADSAQRIESLRIDLDSLHNGHLNGLVADYHPRNPQSALPRARAIRPDTSLFEVVYLDLPGATPHEWDSIYVDPQTKALRSRYQEIVRSFVHPFLAGDSVLGYELIFQYWFFYPFNDGGNNHTGDWEHINVVVAPLDKLEANLGRGEIESMLSANDQERSNLVIRRLEYYPHNNVIIFDLTDPHTYVPEDQWADEKAGTVMPHAGADWIAEQIRRRAFVDAEQSAINTHPIVFIGGDNKGTDQILSAPGGSNRDSHANYPFSGLYKDIGPGGAAEEIDHRFDHRKYFAGTDEDRLRMETFKKGGVLDFSKGERLTIVPDVDRVSAEILSDPVLLRDWYWIVAPMRWGYPAIESPFAGIVAHAETGNLAAVGPPLNDAWNRTGETPVYRLFDAHAVPGFFPTAWQDEFKNSFGYFNAFWPTLSFLPPFDLVYRGLVAPFRMAVEDQKPHFFARQQLPVRYIGISSGVAIHSIDDNFSRLVYNSEQLIPILVGVLAFVIEDGADSTGQSVESRIKSDPAVSAFGQVNFYLGSRFVSENNLRHSRSAFLQEEVYSNLSKPLTLSSELNMWEYFGSLRYNVLPGTVQPFAKVGYGLSWYRYENTSINDEVISVPNSPWIRKPGLSPFENLLPNTFHFGAGLEVLTLKGYEPHLLAGLDLAFSIEWMLFRHSLGVEFEDVPIKELVELGIPIDSFPLNTTIWRHALQARVTVSL